MEKLRCLTDDLDLSKDETSLLLSVLKSPCSHTEAQLKSLATCLIERGCSNINLNRTAAKLCDAVCQIENESTSNKKAFRAIFLTLLQKKYEKQSKLNHGDEWCCFVGFLCSVFDLLKLNNLPLIALVSPVITALSTLTTSKSSHVHCLATQLQLVGEQLEKLNKGAMEDLFKKIDGCYLSEELDQLSRLFLLEVIELRCGGWKLSQSAYNYYYEK